MSVTEEPNIDPSNHHVDNRSQQAVYTDQLRCWLSQAYEWQCMPFMLMSSAPSQSFNSQLPRFPTRPVELRTDHINATRPAHTNPLPGLQTEVERRTVTGQIFKVPRLSKRFLAELIDFGLLFFIKALITLTVLESWNLDDSSINLFNSDGSEEADYELAMAITANLLTIEFVHRILVVFYEVFTQLHQGGTPGKRTMGLRIVTCNRCIPIGENRIIVTPATEISIWKSVGRAFLKNMGTALLFPTFIPLMVVQHNRTLYDIFCGTIVVESD